MTIRRSVGWVGRKGPEDWSKLTRTGEENPKKYERTQTYTKVPPCRENYSPQRRGDAEEKRGDWLAKFTKGREKWNGFMERSTFDAPWLVKASQGDWEIGNWGRGFSFSHFSLALGDYCCR